MIVDGVKTKKSQRVVVVADTPNLYKGTQEAFGCDFEPDYTELLSIAKSRGSRLTAFAMVNDGLPRRHVTSLRLRGFVVLTSEGRDCDYRFVDQAISMHNSGDVFILCGGDGRYANLASVLRGINKYVIVSAVRTTCSFRLLRTANEFFPFPVTYSSSGSRRPATKPISLMELHPRDLEIGGGLYLRDF